MTVNKFLITAEGFKRLRSEIDHLKNIERPKVIKAIAAARELGDLSENADYHASKDKQGIIESKLAELEDKLARAEVIDISKMSGDKVRFGATVKLENLDNQQVVTYKIVSEYEADIDSGLISSVSPVARSLMGKETGDDVEIRTPGGIIEYEILEVNFV